MYDDLKKTVEQITDLIVKQVLALASKGASLTVEGIQDMAEVTLMKNGHHDVARDYIIYRDERKANRESSVSTLKIYRRDKTTPARFNPMKIASSIERAFRRARKIEEQSPDEVVAAVNALTQKIVAEMADLATNVPVFLMGQRRGIHGFHTRRFGAVAGNTGGVQLGAVGRRRFFFLSGGRWCGGIAGEQGKYGCR